MNLPPTTISNKATTITSFLAKNYKLIFVIIIILLGFHLSHPERDLSLFNTESLDQINGGSFYLYDLDNKEDWFPTGHFRGSGELLVEKQVIIHKNQEFPIEQAAMARFHEGGHVEAHHHRTAIESFTGIKGKCIFEIIREDGTKEIIHIKKGNHLILSPNTIHSVRNDEEEDCLMLTTLTAITEETIKHRVFTKKKKNSYLIQSLNTEANNVNMHRGSSRNRD